MSYLVKEEKIKGRGFVCYEDFGAVGDGNTDDFKAIREAHLYANEKGLPVLGTPDKNYRIFDTTLGTDTILSVEIKTDVDWQGATLTIDDRTLTTIRGCDTPMSRRHVFDVLPDDECKMFKITDEKTLSRIAEEGINPRTKRINLGIDWDGRVMIIPYSSAHKVFKRRGYSQYAGADMHEIIVLERDGSVSEETPIIFDYATLSCIDVYKLDSKHAITLKNGNFVTLDTRVNHKIDGAWKAIGYIYRGFDVRRSYTTLENLTHRVEGAFTFADRINGIEGSITNGFFTANDTSNVTLKDCIIPARMSFAGASTYNVHAEHVNKMVLKNCFQPNFWVTVDPETYEIKEATEYVPGITGNARRTSPDAILSINAYYIDGVKHNLFYGFCGTNYCKNLEYIDSTLSRMDAHAALYNGKVINCNITDLELTGYGTFTFEDSNFYQGLVVGSPAPLLYLRSDYGHTWEGNINIKNVNVYTIDNNIMNIAAHNYRNWYYGYTCAFPNITLDNVNYFTLDTEELRDPDYNVRLFMFREHSKRMHLYDSGIKCVLCIVDEDRDGYIDEPPFDVNRDGKVDEKDKIDLDGDGKVGNTSLKLVDYMNIPTRRSGIEHPTCTVNVNPIKPPRYLKIVGNKNSDGTYKCNYIIKDTSNEGISDGAWYRSESDPDTMGGFFGGTEFITDDGTFVGVANNQNVSKTFLFKKEYDE